MKNPQATMVDMSKFIRDAVYFTKLFYQNEYPGNCICALEGRKLQSKMKRRYPKEWMDWLFEIVDWFEKE